MPGVVSIETADGPMDAYLALPSGRARGGVVVAQEAFGVNAHIQDVCRRLAGQGYAALAPELYHRQGRGLTFGYDEYETKVLPRMARLDNAEIEADVKAALDDLRARPELSGRKVAVAGFCMGGFTAFLTACRADPAAAVCFYASGMVRERPGIGLKPIVGEFGRIKAPVLALFGERDPGIPLSDVEAVRSALAPLKTPHEVVVYPGAGHGFFCDQRSSYHPPSAEDAWKRTLEWLGRHVAA